MENIKTYEVARDFRDKKLGNRVARGAKAAFYVSLVVCTLVFTAGLLQENAIRNQEKVNLTKYHNVNGFQAVLHK